MADTAPVESILLSPPAASALSGIGVTRLREAVRMGKIKAVLNGSHTRIFRESLLSYIANLPPYQKADYSRRRRGSTARGHR